MMACTLIALLIFTLCISVSTTLAATVFCSIQTTSGKTIDLSSLDIASSGYNVSGTDTNWMFYFNICGGVTNPSTTTCTIEAQGYQYSKVYNVCYPLSTKGSPKISFLNPADETAGVKTVHSGIAFTDGVTRQIAVSLKCDTAGADRPTLSFTGETREGGVINYGFSGSTKTACPPISCFGIYNSSIVCSGRGICASNNFCTCNNGYSGSMCEITNSDSSTTKIVIGVVISTSLFIMILIIIVIVSVVVWRKRFKRKDDYSSFGDSTNTNSFSVPLMAIEESQYPKQKSDQPLLIPSQELEIISKLGSGGFGSVFKTKWNEKTVAIKTIENESVSFENSISKEALLMCSLSHPNIVDCFGVSMKENVQVIVMEYVEGGSLEKTIQDLKKKYTTMDIDEKLSILLGICGGLNYLHTLSPKAIIHRDLKPANILLDRSKSICKLCDFGLSKPFSTNSVNSLTNNVGTAYYMAKELLEGNIVKEYATALDVYSFSVVMWELIFEESPYNYTNKERLFYENGINPDDYQDLNGFSIIPRVLNGFRPVIPITFGNCSKWCAKFIKSKFPLQVVSEVMYGISILIQNCWNGDPKLRPSINEIIKQLLVLENKLKNR